MPAFRGRKVLKNLTSPWGEQWDYITKIQNKSCTGHWIARNSYQAKKPVEWVESTVNEADLIIYYIHGKKKYISFVRDYCTNMVWVCVTSCFRWWI